MDLPAAFRRRFYGASGGTDALAEAGHAILSDLGAVFACLRRHPEGWRDRTILQYGDAISSQTKSQNGFEIFCGAHIYGQLHVRNGNRQLQSHHQSGFREIRQVRQKCGQAIIVNTTQLVVACGANSAAFAVLLACSGGCPATLTAIEYRKQGFAGRRNDREARANPPVRLFRLLRPGDIGAFDATPRCPADKGAKAAANTGSHVGEAPGTIFAKILRLPAWQSAKEVV
ncbi:hypothetical protein BLA39750_06418 [Burkholderia lata]|uniref:Uncharacterized protein n=1 Tax=Burkholderia lata (strain ATCC 17760 / DSM 23089 / LMG 22485 / NCIMB 9086 / R18194 / 383) TaxID=482957 RepID=A0A6P3B0Y2_BURL3|nr:hypothetical protein BLA39750_06418 [Burkholderia lata]